MTQSAVRNTVHEITVGVPPEKIYAAIADVRTWPQIFPPTVHAELLETTGAEERIEIWATANSEARNWISLRQLDPQAMRIDFRQEVSPPPIASMGGTWIIEPVGTGGSLVRLLHDYRALNDDAEHIEWIEAAVDRNSRSELAALKDNLERSVDREELLLSFHDSVRIRGEIKTVFDFLNEAQHWQERLPHVARVSLQEPSPGLQILEMDTMTRDGSTHTTKSIRVCMPDRKIVYKQITLPALMSLHTGYWELTEDGEDAVIATSQHSVVIKPDAIERVLGPGSDVEKARSFVHNALSTNSMATLQLAKAFAEGRK